MNVKPILVDSNVLIYAINIASSKHKTAQAFLQAHVGHMSIAHQNILESLRVLTHKKFPNPMSSTDAIMAVSNIAERCRVITPDPVTHYLAMELIEKHELTGDKIFDAYLAATALSIGITTVATDNVKDFLLFEGLAAISPFV